MAKEKTLEKDPIVAALEPIIAGNSFRTVVGSLMFMLSEEMRTSDIEAADIEAVDSALMFVCESCEILGF